MQRPVCWVERQEDGIKREVEVQVGRGQVKWRFKRATETSWDCASRPSREDWDHLLVRMENRHQRRNASLADLELVRRLHGKTS